jgi:hypothetical protein
MIKPTLDRFCLYLCCTLIAQGLFFARLKSQTVIGGDTIDQSAVLDIQDNVRRVLLPRLPTVQRNAIVKPVTGLLTLNTTKKRLENNIRTPDVPNWKYLTVGISKISDWDWDRMNRESLIVLKRLATTNSFRSELSGLSENSIPHSGTQVNFISSKPISRPALKMKRAEIQIMEMI